MTPAIANSRGGFSRLIVTVVSFVVTLARDVTRFGCVCVIDVLLVERIVVVVVLPMTEKDTVDVEMVDVVELTTTAVLVVLVVSVEELIVVT
jgi:hypothetical protein